ncbi:MAG: hypothetical protein AB8G77_08735 [Rhodothermales bacterium]
MDIDTIAMRISSSSFVNRARHLCEGRDPVFMGHGRWFIWIPAFAGMTVKGVGMLQK